MKFKLEKISKGKYRIIFISKPNKSKKFVGYALVDVDGFFYIHLHKGDEGSWSPHCLILMAKKVEKLNKKWNKKLKKEISK